MNTRLIVSMGMLSLMAACGPSSDSGGTGSGGTTANGTGGATATGGAPSGTGGASASTGGIIDASASDSSIISGDTAVPTSDTAVSTATGMCGKLAACCASLGPDDKPSCDMQVSVAGANQGACEMYLYTYVNFSKCGSTPGVATITVTASVKGAAATSWNCNTVGTSNLWLQYANTLAQPKDVGTVVCINGLTGASKLSASFTAPTTVGSYLKSSGVFSIGLGEGGQAINIDTYKSNTESATLEVKTWDPTARQMTGTAEATWADTGASWGFGTVKITFDVIFPTI